ncbi:MAG: ABC transporter permease [Oscillospiraceae bacterium]|nr:ABC transporter permease [Oscillospiraceae bacterium]
MGILTLLSAGLRRHKGSLIGILLLALIAAAAMGTVLTVWTNSTAYVQDEMERAGFGEITAWVSGITDVSELAADIETVPEVERVEIQPLIFSNYKVNGGESDSEGQLITYSPADIGYKFFTDDLSGYREQPSEIPSGCVYVSPSMATMLDVKLGDEIIFPIARSGKNLSLTVKGFYEDPFMGSSMIGMKGFLISESDRAAALAVLQNAGIDALARDGAMLHIFSAENLTVSELNGIINEKTALSQYAEFVHGKDAILGFMVILQNAFCGLMTAFAAVLLIVVAAVIGHSISGTISAETVNMGILKTVGFDSRGLRTVQLLMYLIPIVIGFAAGTILSVPLSIFAANATVTTTGIKIPSTLPIGLTAVFFAVTLLLLGLFIILRTKKITKISPMSAIRGEAEKAGFSPEKTLCAFGRGMSFRLALRQLISGKRRYIGALATAVLLAFFASLIGRMDGWLGRDGKGMMDAFNPADHDLGIQIFGSLTAEEAEKTVLAYSDIVDSYWLAMPGAAVNGVDFTINVIDQPERFHMLEGRTCAAENEVVLTEFVAASFGVSIGDTVTVSGGKGSGGYTVSGIYSCANDMGDNIGMSREGYLKIGNDDPRLWCRHYFLADPSQKYAITEALETAYGGDVHVHENTWPGLFGIISAMRILIVVMYALTAAFILIVTTMTSGRIISVEQRDLGIYKAVGFGTSQLRTAFAVRFGITALVGAAVGMILAAALTDPLVSAVMKLAGISNFSSAPSIESVLLPIAVVTALFTIFAYLASGKVRHTDLTVLISE